MLTEKEVIKFYTYFYKKRFNSFNYKYKPSEKAEKIISNFLKLIDKKYNLKLVGEHFLWDYFIYQFNYWRDAKLTAFHGKFRIELIIGKKAFDRWYLDLKGDHWVIEKSEIITLYHFVKSELIEPEKPIYKGFHEIAIKELKLNTEEGFYHCITSTTMYNHKHLCCLKCNFKNDCKKVLKEKLPEVYETRGY